MILLSSSLNSFIQLMGALLIFLFVLLITYLTTKWVGGYQKASLHNKNLQIAEVLKLDNNKYITLVKAGEVYLVLAVAKDNVTLLARLTEEQLAEVPSLSAEAAEAGTKDVAESFQNILEKVKKNFPKKQG